jgi:hypothetical protein
MQPQNEIWDYNQFRCPIGDTGRGDKTMPKIQYEEYEYPDLSQLKADETRAKLRVLLENFSDLIQEISGLAIMQKEADREEIDRLKSIISRFVISYDLLMESNGASHYMDIFETYTAGNWVQHRFNNVIDDARDALSRAEEVTR